MTERKSLRSPVSSISDALIQVFSISMLSSGCLTGYLTAMVFIQKMCVAKMDMPQGLVSSLFNISS